MMALYVPPEHAADARAAHDAWATFWTVGCAIAALNREQLRQQWQRAAPPRAPRAGLETRSGIVSRAASSSSAARDAVQAWIRQHGDTYRIKRFVSGAADR